ncbi:MAG: YHYH protein [Prosthecobacter sp.]|uniref:YHYH protein n=1 Tax=Prosthecobacter sp. TaxID=1965333 RepID=UPI0019E1AF5C|nr:YHYH protein [Prosthecobacter sp.]MBE2283494.1 YHYH protein [Prosthecobacter sp.]
MKPSRRSFVTASLLLRTCGCVLASACLAASTTLPPSEVKITTDGDYRRIQANGIPDHEPGQFPNRRNPNTIAPQVYDYKVPLHPKVAAKPSPFRMQPFGIAVNGVVFDPFAAEWWQNDPNSGWQYEPHGGAIDLGIDSSNAHVQPNGAYHYHGIPNGLLEKLSGNKPQMTLLGWAADGFPIYGPWGYSEANNAGSSVKKLTSSYAVKSGSRPEGSPGGKYDGAFVQDYEYVEGSGDLDASNGRQGVTPEFPKGTYYYVLTNEYPFIPRQFAGTPDASFERRGPGGPGGFGPPGRGRRGGPGGPPGMRPPPPRGLPPPPPF